MSSEPPPPPKDGDDPRMGEFYVICAVTAILYACYHARRPLGYVLRAAGYACCYRVRRPAYRFVFTGTRGADAGRAGALAMGRVILYRSTASELRVTRAHAPAARSAEASGPEKVLLDAESAEGQHREGPGPLAR